LRLSSGFLRQFLIVSCLCSVAQHGFAQGVPIPSSAEAAAAENRAAILPPLRTETLIVPDDDNLACTFGPGLAGVSVMLRNIAFEGAEKFPEADLSPSSTGLPVGQVIAVNDICTATRLLTRDIRNAGYVFSRAYLPEQDITDGRLVFHFQAVRVGDVRIEGDDPGGFLTAIGDANRALEPYDANRVTTPAALSLGDRLPRVDGQRQNPISTTALADRDTLADTTTFVLSRNEVDTSPRYRFSVDNRGSKANGPWALDASATWYETFAPYDILGVRVLQSPDLDELSYASVAYDYLLRPNGTALRFRAALSRSEPGTDTLAAIEEENESQSLSFSWYQPLRRTQTDSLAFVGRFDLRNSSSTQLGAPATDDRLRVFRAGLEFSKSYQNFSTLQLVGTLSQGIDGLGSTKAGNPLATRSDGKTRFTKADIFARYIRDFESGFRFTALAKGQLSSDSLLSAEECGVGGATFGRGFNSSEITGDHCVAASIEVSRTITESLPSGLSALQPYAFIDGGMVYNSGTQPDESLASAGLGIRADFSRGISGSLEIAKPINRDSEFSGDKSPRFFVGLSASF